MEALGKGLVQKPRFIIKIGDRDPCDPQAAPIDSADTVLLYPIYADILKTNSTQSDRFRAVFAIGKGQDWGFWAGYKAAVFSFRFSFDGKDYVEIFYGSADMIELDQNKQEVTVTGRNWVKLFINNQQTDGNYIEQSIQDIFTKNAKDVGLEAKFQNPPLGTYGTVVGDAKTHMVRGVQSTHIKAWDVIGNLALHSGMTSFVEGNTIYFFRGAVGETYQCVAGTVTFDESGKVSKIGPSNAISLRFEHNLNMVVQNLVVAQLHDYNEPNWTLTKSEESECKKATQNPYALHHTNLDPEDSQTRVDSLAGHMGTYEWTCEWQAADPDLLNMRVIDQFNVQGTNSECNGLYIVTQIEHNFSWEHGMTSTINGKWGRSLAAADPSSNQEGA